MEADIVSFFSFSFSFIASLSNRDGSGGCLKLFQTLLGNFRGVDSKGLCLSSEKEKENCCLVFYVLHNT